MLTFWWLLVAHAFTDYVWQPEEMGRRKQPHVLGDPTYGPWWWTMTAHALVNGGGVAVVTQDPLLGMAETVVHFLTDWWKCVASQHPTYIGEDIRRIAWIDQGIHLASKCLWALLA